MKKNVLALSITAALIGFGFAGGAQAIGLNKTTGNPITVGAGDHLETSVDGTGQFLYVPYYTVQGGNVTMMNIVNTDTVNGKAVKVRFRAAANSDDVMDFQVFLSPGDVWAAGVYQDTTSAKNTRLVTADTSCTKPTKTVLNATAFSTVRLDTLHRTGDALVNEAREGYVEIFNMADIPPVVSTSSLFQSIKHTAGVPRNCASTAFTALNTDPDTLAAANTLGLAVPTTGLMANWIILNAANSGAWSGASPALNAVTSLGAITTGALVYFPQTDDLIPNPAALGLTATQRVAQFTSDPWLIAHAADVNPVLRTYDLPDFSIPYTAATTPNEQVVLLSQAISTRKVMNEYLTDEPSLIADTDWVLSMPTRRYSAAYDYTVTPDGVALYNTGLSAFYFTAANTFVLDGQICTKGLTTLYFDREETTPGPLSTGVIVSPQPPGQAAAGFNICGEASVLSFNNSDAVTSGLVKAASGALGATVARSTIETLDGSNHYTNGWLTINTPGITPTGGVPNGLPILGYEAVKALSTGTHAFGATLPHRTDRIQK